MEIIIVVILFVLAIALYFMKSMTGVMTMKRALPGLQAYRQIADRSDDIIQAGITEYWDQCDLELLSSSLTGTTIFRPGRDSEFQGPLELQVRDYSIVLFDWRFNIRVAKSTYQPYFQTVAVIAPDDFDVPQFYLRPRGLHDHFFSLYESVQTDTPLDLNFILESVLPYRAKALFESQLGGRLIEFVSSRGWTIESTGKSLAVYSLDQLVPPDRLAQNAAELIGLAELLRDGAKAVAAELDQRVEMALGAGTTS